MKKLILLLAVVIGGVLVYSRFFSAQARAASKLASLCDETVSAKDMSDAKQLLGDHYDAAIACVNDCPEALGCLLGGAGDRLDEVGKDLDRGIRNYEKHRQ
jgi:hypothetical protein